MKFKLAYSSLRWQTPDIEAGLKAMRETGWEGWEIRQSLDWLGSAKRVKKISDDAGVPVAVVCGTGISLDNNYEMKERNKRRIDFAADVEADTFMFMGAGRPYGRTVTSDEIKALADLSDELADYAAQYNLDVCYHIHTGTTIDTREEWELLMRLMKRAQLCIDVSHAAFWGYDPAQSIRDFSDRLVYVHLQDYKGYRFVELGDGNLLDFAASMKALEEIGYNRWITVCPSATDLPDREKMQRDREYLRKLGY
ncbi:MAG: sugar phosphate isomerase/epimerase [candidate division Zixibacteria bacterium]|nr:sugar phosphate isomerase/epimerase [candidate division Zixibacteria bacterium]